MREETSLLKNYQVVYISLELLIALLAVAGNILVCWSVCLNSNLQSITNFFVVSLAVADIAVGLLAIPFAITISVGFCADFYGCLFIACFVLVLTQSSIFSLLAIAVDRYIAIKNPLRYNSVVTGQRAKGIIALCWALSVGIGLTPMFGWNTRWNSTAIMVGSTGCPQGMTQCLFEKVVTLNYMVYFNFFGCVMVPLLIMLVIYINIFMAARRQLRLMTIKVAHIPVSGQRAASSSSGCSVLQKEVHAAKSLAIIVGLFALCWLPLHIINCFNHMCQGCERPHIWVMNIAIILSHANSVVNPFIYAYRIREFRQTFRKIFYQYILRWRDGHGNSFWNADDKSAGSNSFRRTSQSNREGSSLSMVVNGCVKDPSPDQTRQKDTHELSSNWESILEVKPCSSIPSGPQEQSNTLSLVQKHQRMGFSAQIAVKSSIYMGDVLELKDRRSCSIFANVQALSQTQTSTTDITEVS